MTGLKVVILLGFALMFAAGLAVGRAGLLAAKPALPPGADTSYLAARLNLSADQQKQMEDIYSAALAASPDMPAMIHKADGERDAQVEQFLTPDQLRKFTALETQHDQEIQDWRDQRDKVMHEAQEKARAMLDDKQKAIFEQIIKERGQFSPSMRPHHNAPRATQP